MTDQNKALTTLNQFQKLFNKDFKLFFERKKKEIAKLSPSTRILIEILEEFAFRSSKRIRPALVYFGYQAAGGKDLKEVLKLSQTVELLHTFALIHDDLIDKATERRGEPTVDRIFTQHASKHITDKKHFGLSSAILTGDLGFAYADEIFTTGKFDPSIINTAKKYYDLLRNEVISGQFLDILLTNDFSITKDKVLHMLTLKSGKYTVERPLHIGAALAGAKSAIFKAYTNFGIPLGLAFQIQDDILGIFGDEKRIGKPTDSDLKGGKNTLILAITIERANFRQRQFLEKVVGNDKAIKADIAKVKEIIIKIGALEQTKSEVEKLILNAKRALINVKLELKSKEFLIGIADYVGERVS